MNAINHEQKALFFHVPKCAGTTISKTLLQDDDWTVANVKDVNDSVKNGYFTFTFSRNPYDRFLSGWKHVKYKRDDFIFDLQVFHDDYKLLDLPNNINHRTFPNIHFFWTQTKILPHSFNVLENVSQVFRFENLEEDLGLLLDRFEVKTEGPIQKMNASCQETPYKECINAEIAAHIEEKYADDFENFGYSHEKF